MNEELKRTPVTFPVTTACFSVDDDGNILDEAFSKEMISEVELSEMLKASQLKAEVISVDSFKADEYKEQK